MSTRHTANLHNAASASSSKHGIKKVVLAYSCGLDASIIFQSSMPQYREDLAMLEKDEGLDQNDANGFIRLNALRLAIGKTNRKVHPIVSTKKKGS